MLLAVPSWANSLDYLEETACQGTYSSVDQMARSEKLCRAFVRALKGLPEATAVQAQALLTPENLTLMAATTAIWLGSQGIPLVGQVVDAALLSLGVILLAAQASDVAHALWSYANRAIAARVAADLDAAASHLSRALATVGINVVAFVLMKKAGMEAPRHPAQASTRLATSEGLVEAGTAMSGAANVVLAAGERGPGGVSRAGLASLSKALDLKAFALWIAQAPKQLVRESSQALKFQIKHGGPEEVLVSGGGQRVWADGVNPGKAMLREVKYIESPDKSPYVPSSNCNAEIRALIKEQTLDQFQRYAAVLRDEATPAVALEVITNEVRAVPFFEALMREAGVLGEVVVKP
jgi:hypothetical protein